MENFVMAEQSSWDAGKEFVLKMLRWVFRLPQASITHKEAVKLACRVACTEGNIPTNPWISKHGLRYCVVTMHQRKGNNSHYIVDLVSVTAEHV